MNIKSAIVRRLSQLIIDSDLELSEHKLKFIDVLLRRIDVVSLGVRNLADTTFGHLYLNTLYIMGNVFFRVSNKAISSPNVDNAYTTIKTRRNTAGLFEVARIAGGVEEAFEFSKMRLTGELKGNGQVISNTLIADEVTSAPAADDTQVGRIIRVRSGAGVATSVQMCCLNSANAYEWVTLGTAT